MFFKTRLSRYFAEILSHLKTNALTLQNTFSLALFFLFIGFLCGNLFGTFLDTLRLYFFWNGLVGLFLLLFIETINFLVYGFFLSKRVGSLGFLQYRARATRAKKSFLQKRIRFYKIYKKVIHIERIINAFKIGLLFGFFVDSFKVGS